MAVCRERSELGLRECIGWEDAKAEWGVYGVCVGVIQNAFIHLARPDSTAMHPF